MAIVQQQKKLEAHVISTAPSISYDTVPTAGNLLIWIFTADKNPVITIPTGWNTIFNTTNGSVSKAAAWRVSDGTETTVTAGLSATRSSRAWIAEYTNASYDVQANNYTDTAGNSLSTGTTPTTNANAALGLCMWCNDSGGNADAPTFTWTNGYVTEDLDFSEPPDGSPGLAVGSKVITGGGTEETTGGYTGGGVDQMGAGILTLIDTDPGGGGPTLTSPTGSSTGMTTAVGSVSTDTDNGTLYAIVSTSGTAPSVAQIQAGQDSSGSSAAWSGNQTVSATGVQNVSATGLTAATNYYFHYQQQDGSSTDGAVVTSPQFTTDAAPVVNVTGITDPITTGGSATLTGTNFDATQGVGGVTQQQGVISVDLTEASWSDTSVTVTTAAIESTQLKYGSNTFELTSNSGSSDTITSTVNPASGSSFVDLSTLVTSGLRITAIPDLASGDQLRYDSVLSQGGSPTAFNVTVHNDGSFTFDGTTPNGVYSFEVRAWDDSDQTWGTVASQQVIVAIPITISTPSGALNLSGNIPSVVVSTDTDTTIVTPSGSINLAGNTPTVVVTQNSEITTPSGSINLVGNTPTVTVSQNQSIQTPSGSLNLVGTVPNVEVTIGGDIVVNTPSGNLNLVGNIPTVQVAVDLTIETPSGNISFTGNTPSVFVSQDTPSIVRYIDVVVTI